EQYPIGAIADVLDFLIHKAVTQTKDHERQHREDKGDAHIQHAPPFGPGFPVLNEASDDGERRRDAEHDRSRDGQRTIPKRPWVGGERSWLWLRSLVGWLRRHRMSFNQMGDTSWSWGAHSSGLCRLRFRRRSRRLRFSLTPAERCEAAGCVVIRTQRSRDSLYHPTQ